MKKISKTVIISAALMISGGLIAGLAVASSMASGSGHEYGQHGKHHMMKPFKMDTNNDGLLSKEEVLSRNVMRFEQLDSDGNGSINADEFNAHLIAMFSRMDSNGDGLLSPDELPRKFGKGHHGGSHHDMDHDDDDDYERS